MDFQDLVQDLKTVMMTHSEVINGFGGFILREPGLSLHYCLAQAVSHKNKPFSKSTAIVGVCSVWA